MSRLAVRAEASAAVLSPGPTPRRGARGLAVGARLVVALLVALAGLGLGPIGGPQVALAAAPDLTLVTATTYEVRPDEGRVAVTVQITATNHLKDTTTRRFFFEQGFLGVLPGTSNFALTAASGSPSVAVSSRTADGVLLRLRFGQRLAAGKSLALTLTFDLADPGGAPDRPLRVSPSLVLFQAWAYGTPETPGSSVDVRVPAGYNVVLGGDALAGPATDADGWLVYSSGPLEAPLTFAADVAADRPGGYVDGRRSATVGGRTAFIVFRAWPDDPAWRTRVSDLVIEGLPVLADEIGVPWPLTGPLTVTETLIRTGVGYAGTFDPVADTAQIGYAASPGVVLHEAAHAWFNGSLVADRWIAEAFASLYAERAAAALGVAIESPDLASLPPGPTFPLNAWPAAGEATAAEEAYGFAASLALAREIAALVGDDALRATWLAAAGGAPAYQPGSGAAEGSGTGTSADNGGPPAASGDPTTVATPASGTLASGTPAGSTLASAATPAGEASSAPPDWRALLDLLEANADPAAAAGLERLWRRWVIRPDDAALLEARTDARAAYAAAVDGAAPWQLPRPIRDAMRAWQYDAATRLMADAASVLRQRDAVEEAATGLGLTPPDALRVAFEAPDGLVAAPAEAAAELAALGAIRAATAARITDPGPFDRLGLIGLDPDARLSAARAAFEAGDQDSAIAQAAAAEAQWAAAPDVARGRLQGAGLLALALVLLAWLVAQRRRSRRSVRAHARRP